MRLEITQRVGQLAEVKEEKVDEVEENETESPRLNQ